MSLQKRFWFFFFLLIFVQMIFGVARIQANEKYTTIVNPVRSRELWIDKTLKPIDDQYQTINTLKLKATWLIQNDVVNDQDLVKKLKSFNQDQELGLFLEISPKLTQKTRIY